MYSQNKEDEIIDNYFGDYKGALLDIGANDGETLSNSRLLINKGWGGVLVEPSITCLNKLNKLYNNTQIQILPYAVSIKCGKNEFWESGEHITKDDHSLISTLKESELSRWSGTKFANHTKTTVNTIDFKTLLKKSKHKRFEFINIDAEGVDFEILEQINLYDVGCKVLCIEWNGNQTLKQKILTHIGQFWMVNELHENSENMILCKL